MPELHPDHERQANHPSRVHPSRHILTRAVGAADDVEVDILRKKMNPGDTLLLCSDGLWEVVLEYEMAEIVNSTPDPAEACNRLVALANERGGHDSISVIVIKADAETIPNEED